MAKVKVSDLVFWTDVLTETKFKPWWETLRAYSLVGLHIIALMIIYMLNPEKSTICHPVKNSTNGTLRFDELGNDAVDSYCATQINWVLRYFGYIAFGACLIIHATYSWWLFVPKVKYTFQSLRRFEDKFHGVGLTKEETQQLLDEYVETNLTAAYRTDRSSSSRQHTINEKLLPDRVTVKAVCQMEGNAGDMRDLQRLELLIDVIDEIRNFKAHTKISLPTIYCIRNLIALLAVSVCIYGLHFLYDVAEWSFRCTFASFDLDCSHDILEQIRPFVFCGEILLILIGLITFFAILAAVLIDKSSRPCLKEFPDGKKADYAFAMFFGDNSLPISLKADIMFRVILQVVAALRDDLNLHNASMDQEDTLDHEIAQATNKKPAQKRNNDSSKSVVQEV